LNVKAAGLGEVEVMSSLAYTLRVVALSIMFGGSVSVIFCAMALISSAHQHGVATADAAAANAPMFTMFSIVLMFWAFVLLVGEALSYAAQRKLTLSTKARFASSLLCVAAAMVLKFGIIPQMEQITLKPDDQKAHAAFKKLHSVSRADFMVIIVTALVSLLIPGFESSRKDPAPKPEETPAVS